MADAVQGQPAAGLEVELAARGRELGEDGGVVGRGDDDRHVLEVLGGRADEGHAADVDVLDDVAAVGRGRAGGDALEGVEVHDDEVDGLEAERLGLRGLMRVRAAQEDAPVDLGVQGLDASVEDLGIPGHRLERPHLDAGVDQGLGGARGGDDLDAQLLQALGEGGAPVLLSEMSARRMRGAASARGGRMGAAALDLTRPRPRRRASGRSMLLRARGRPRSAGVGGEHRHGGLQHDGAGRRRRRPGARWRPTRAPLAAPREPGRRTSLGRRRRAGGRGGG